jgi:molybdate transport system ATP-binding protein
MIRLSVVARLARGGFRLDVADRSSVEVLGLFGPSGAGKTTILEVIAGLRRPDWGEVGVADRILFSSERGIEVPVHRRHIGYVPQDVALFPHLSVRANILYGAARRFAPPARWRRLRRLAGSGRLDDTVSEAGGARPAAGARRDLEHVCDVLDIASLLDRGIGGLSGGERQRVAIARALMSAPAVLLLDEPLTAVDRDRRDRILPYLLRIRRELHVPLVYVTHDRAEMAEIADRVLVLSAGRLVAAGPPGEVLEVGDPSGGYPPAAEC